MPGNPQKVKHDHTTLFFPEGFLWGAATSAHQVEGNNVNSDWWDFEQKNQPPEKRSGLACDQYNRYAEDFELAKNLNHNAHRLSIEWARIEPKEGEFDQPAIDHYIQVLKALKDKGFTVMLTLHHFTNPKWLADKGGWKNGKVVFYFERFVKKIVPEIKEYVDLWITINEPNVYAYNCYFLGVWPPQKKSKWLALKVLWNMAKAHKKAYNWIHKLTPTSRVGAACNVASLGFYHKHSIIEALTVWATDSFGNHLFYKLTGNKYHDFLGLNYYFNQNFSYDKKHTVFPPVADISISKKDVSDMGWEIYPEGIFDVLMDFADYKLPIYITENGIATTNDDRRCRFLIAYLKEIYHAIEAGVEVKGYFHWSLIDNFEWANGFEPRFGLVEIDYQTQKRTLRPSSKVYAEIIKTNGIYHHLLRFLGHTVQAEEVLYPKVTG